MAMPDLTSNKIKVKEQTTLGQESIKASGEAVGITQIPDQATSYLADEATYRIKEIFQVIIIIK